MVKDSAPVSSTPSESSNGRRKEKRENGEGVEEEGETKGESAMCQPAHVRREHERYSRVGRVNTARRQENVCKVRQVWTLLY